MTVKRVALSSLFYSLLWTFLLTVAIPILPPNKIALATLYYILLFLIVFSTSILYIRWNEVQNLQPADSCQPFFGTLRGSLVVLLISLSVQGAYFYTFYPGLVTWDFFVQWQQVSGSEPFNDWHPVFHSLIVWLLTRIWFSPAIVTIAQIIAFSVLLIKTLRSLECANVIRVVLVVVSIFYICYPLHGFYMVSLWKDIAYALSLWWFTLLFLEIVETDGLTFKRWTFALQFIIAITFVALIRHNGIFVALFSAFILLIAFRSYFYRILGLISIFLVMVLMYKLVIFSLLDVDRDESLILKAHLPVQHIGAILKNGAELTDEEQIYLNEIIPLNYWRKGFNYYTCMPLVHGRDKTGKHYLNWELLRQPEEFKKFLWYWANLAVKYPKTIIKYHIIASEFVWKIRSKARVFVIPDENILGEHLFTGYDHTAPDLRKRIDGFWLCIVNRVTDRSTGWLFHRGSIFFLASLFAIGLSLFFNRGFKTLILATPLILQTLTLGMFPLVQGTRFIYPVILMSPVLIAYVFSIDDHRVNIERGT